jgi:hypothetical protein
MAASWKTLIKETAYDDEGNYGNVSVEIQYDANSITPTSLTCRAVGRGEKNEDTYFIYSSDGAISRICYQDRYSDLYRDPYYSNTFKITKSKTATSFKIPELALCNDGSYRGSSEYNDDNGRGYYVYFVSGRVYL